MKRKQVQDSRTSSGYVLWRVVTSHNDLRLLIVLPKGLVVLRSMKEYIENFLGTGKGVNDL